MYKQPAGTNITTTTLANNQIVVTTPKYKLLFSYDTLVCIQSLSNPDKVWLSTSWDYSLTTIKYVIQFLCENKADIRDKLLNNKYKLVGNTNA